MQRSTNSAQCKHVHGNDGKPCVGGLPDGVNRQIDHARHQIGQQEEQELVTIDGRDEFGLCDWWVVFVGGVCGKK